MSTIFEQGLLLTAYGLGGVFVSLIIFYIMVRLIMMLFPEREEKTGK